MVSATADRPVADARICNAFRAALVFLFGLAFVGAANAQVPPPLNSSDMATLRSAFALEDGGRWSDAISMSARIRDPVARKLVLWRANAEAPNPGDFSELAAFIDGNPHWPIGDALLAQAEKALYEERGYRDVAGWLRRHPPVSGLGHILQAESLMARGKMQEGIALLRKSWAEDGYPSDIEPDVLARFSVYLRAADHAARVNELLWDRRLSAAERLMSLLDPEHRALAKARMDLIRLSSRAGAKAGTITGRLRRDPGLLFDEVRWHRLTGSEKTAAALLRSLNPEQVTERHADKWWDERNRLIRQLLSERDYAAAYSLASKHGQKDGADFAEAEWLAGWIALRFLNKPAEAYTHFSSLYNSVSRPISLARGAYWAGRAATASGRVSAASKWYDEASRYSTTFYGQLAAQAINLSAARTLPPAPVPTATQRQAFAAQETVRAARILVDLKRDRYVRQFARRMTEDAKGTTDWVLLGRLFGQLGRTDLEVWVGKQASYRHIILPAIAYPQISLPAAVTVDPALIHGLSRQESAFYPRAVSSAGARGLMQLMPSTAKMVADQIGVPYSLPRLTSDPRYNATLGSSYLQKMVDRFDGAYVLAIAAYNAGPGRVSRWLGELGDPRTGQIDMLDWIELIPISETRNYVQRVLENTQVYRQLMGGRSVPIRIHDDVYRGATAEPAAGVSGHVPS